MRSGSEGTRATPAPNAISGGNDEPNDVESEDVLEIIYESGSNGSRGTIRWADGDVYEGELKDGQPNGRGSCKYGSGNVYDGEWKDGWVHGTGTRKFASGDSYLGNYRQGKRHGKGTMTCVNDIVYAGEWKDDTAHGWGMESFVNGDVYEGEFKDSWWHGKGTLKYSSGDVYEGEFADGWRDGWGKMTWAAGGVYEGEWRKGTPHGKGTMNYPSGAMYEGDWLDGMPKPKGGVESETAAPGASAEMRPGRERRVYTHERTLRSAGSQQRHLQENLVPKTCEHCGTDDGRYKLRVCSGCDLALYCSAACQKAASRSHRRICDIVSELPPRDSDRLTLRYDRDKMVDLDAGLRYATKYMGNLRHVEINVFGKDADDAIKLSAKMTSSLFRSKKGALDTVIWDAPSVFEYDHEVWKELHGLKRLRIGNVRCTEVQYIQDVICRQKNSLEVLYLPYLRIEWRRAKCRRAFAQAVNSCKQLVKLDLEGCMLMDSDLKIVLGDLRNLRCLSLKPCQYRYNHEFTDNTCGIIARKCPGLQELNLWHHFQLSVRGIRKIFEGCTNLRSFFTSSRKLSGEDVQSLLDIAPQLLAISMDDISCAVADREWDEIIEATGGRTLVSIGSGDDSYFYEAPAGRLSSETRNNYSSQIWLYRGIEKQIDDPEVANEWADMLQE